MDRKDFESLLNKYPDCVSDGKKLKAFLKDLYPDVPKAIVSTLTIMADDGIIAEMQMLAASSLLVSARLQKKLEDDYGLSQKIISECFSLIIYDSAKKTQATNSERLNEKINEFIDVQFKSTYAEDKSTKQPNLNFEYDDFEIFNGVLEEYKGRSSGVVIPDGVTSIGRWAFSDCSVLIRVTIPGSVTSIGDWAFDGCTGLKNIIIPDSVTSIGDHAFSGCFGLTSVTIGNSVTSIGDCAFFYCRNLTRITIGSRVASIGNCAFIGCSGLTIYCEALSKPSGWNSGWNPDNRPVVWGVKNKT